MGVSQFTIVMPHGNFFAYPSPLPVGTPGNWGNPKETGVGASNFLSKTSLDQAKLVSKKAGFTFVAVEYEKNIRCNFELVNEFIRENPEVFSFYVGVLGGKVSESSLHPGSTWNSGWKVCFGTCG